MRQATLVVPLMIGWLSAMAASPTSSGNGIYVATAYSQAGLTASGIPTKRHIVAADPDVLPIGSRIKVKGAGRYSGEYVVADTGRKIQGRRLDIYMPNDRSCVRFGRKSVKVRIIQVGDGTKQTTETAAHQVKKDVQNELSKKAVGGAATEDDWAAKKKADVSSAASSSTGEASASQSPGVKPQQ